MIKRSLERKESLQKINSTNKISNRIIKILDKDISESIVKELKDEMPKDIKNKTTITKEEFINRHK